MPGKRVQGEADFITPRRIYREVISAVDPSIESLAIPILDTRETANQRASGPNAGFDTPQYGRNAQINLAVLMSGFTSVTLQLWLLAEEEQDDLTEPFGSSSSSSSSSFSLSATDEWVKAAQKDFTGPELWVVKDIPPGQYKVRMSAASGGPGQVQLREQYAA